MCYQTPLIKEKEEIRHRFRVDLDNLMSVEDFELSNTFEYPKTPITTNETAK
jgi:hypothetical protein